MESVSPRDYGIMCILMCLQRVLEGQGMMLCFLLKGIQMMKYWVLKCWVTSVAPKVSLVFCYGST